jgi:phosphoenolpyruvate---glycerone phosphotransferase subunit DhaK
VKKFINDPSDTLKETLAGFSAAHSDLIVVHAEHKFVTRKQLSKNKVALISGGGSGHEPMHIGFVGHGMLDAACVGQTFTSPSPDQIIAAAQAVDSGEGLIFIVKNYQGDRMNFEMAQEVLGNRAAIVIVNDDVGTGAVQISTERRGVAGTLIVEKMLGAAAEQKMSMAKLLALNEKVSASTRTMGVALKSGTVPAAGKPTFSIADDEIELGVGIHGEQGRRRIKHKTADELAADMISSISDDLQREGEALLFLNGFGGTPLMELYIMFNACKVLLAKRGIKVVRSLVGNYVTSLDMAGCSITVTLLDDELLTLWDRPVFTPSLRWQPI